MIRKILCFFMFHPDEPRDLSTGVRRCASCMRMTLQ